MDEEQIIQDEEFRKQMGYGYPIEEEKQNVFAFFKRVIAQKENLKTANLLDDEMGQVKIPVRTNLEIAGYCKAMKMDAFAKCFTEDAQIILATSLSREGMLNKLAVTQKREGLTTIKKPGEQVKKGWFTPKPPPEAPVY